jgi:hypothetical protein
LRYSHVAFEDSVARNEMEPVSPLRATPWQLAHGNPIN